MPRCTRAGKEVTYLGYDFQTYGEVITKAEQFGSGLKSLNMCPPLNEFEDFTFQFVSVFAPNITNWYILDIMCMVHGM